MRTGRHACVLRRAGCCGRVRSPSTFAGMVQYPDASTTADVHRDRKKETNFWGETEDRGFRSKVWSRMRTGGDVMRRMGAQQLPVRFAPAAAPRGSAGQESLLARA